MLSRNEITQYNKHLLLPEIGMKGQEKIKSSRVLVVGAGGLGCPVLQFLSAAGVGVIGIVDSDRVEAHNLPRQILYSAADIGQSKAITAAEKIKLLNPFNSIRSFDFRLDAGNARSVICDFDIVVDCSDNPETRYLINDTCVLLGKPCVYGGIYKFEGQVSVFNFREKNGSFGPDYRCFFPEPDISSEPVNCALNGVINTLPGIIGTLQANEVLKIITGAGEVCSGKMLVMNLLKNSFSIIEFSRTETVREKAEKFSNTLKNGCNS